MAIAVSNSGGNDHHDFHNGLSEVNRGETYPGSFKLQRVDKSNMHLPSSNKDMHIPIMLIVEINSSNYLHRQFILKNHTSFGYGSSYLVVRSMFISWEKIRAYRSIT
jgi:hypothetical protein